MKKVLMILVGILSLFLSGCGKGSIEEITFTDYQKMVENKESFILFIGSHNCNHCMEFEITLNEVVEKYNIDFKYIDIANFSEEERKTFNIKFDGTPTTVFINDGEDNSCNVFSCDNTKRISGAKSYEQVVELLKNNGYIKG